MKQGISIDKAIENLTQLHSIYNDPGSPGYRNAIRLGIKALERFRNLRNAGKFVGMPMLKGETKD